MSTATAIKPRPTDTKIKEVTMELVPALAEDLKYFVGWEENDPSKKIMKLRAGLIYWLYSYVNSEMEPIPYIITAQTDPDDLKGYLDAEMIYIAKNPFKE